jgi:hypothetical protein
LQQWNEGAANEAGRAGNEYPHDELLPDRSERAGLSSTICP